MTTNSTATSARKSPFPLRPSAPLVTFAPAHHHLVRKPSRMRKLHLFLALFLATLPLPAQGPNWITTDPSFIAPAPAGTPKQVLPESVIPAPSGIKITPAADIRSSLAAARAQVAAHPKDAATHIQLAYILLDAGTGDRAQTEARQATILAPHSAAAWQALGWTLEHNVIAVRFGGGFDWQGSIAAWQHAGQLAPKNTDTRLQLITLYEQDANGFRFTSASRLTGAVREGNELKQLDPTLAAKYEDHLRKDILALGSTPFPGPAFLPASDPRAAVQRLILAELTHPFDQHALDPLLAHHAYPNDDLRQRALQRNRAAAGTLQMQWKKSGINFDFLFYNALATLNFSATGNDDLGYRITLQRGDAPSTQSFFVIKEDGMYRIVANSRNDAETGAEALYLLHQGNQAAARSLLDWKREQTNTRRNGANDALDASLAYFWPASQGNSTDDLTLAAASLLVARSDIQSLLPQIATIRERSSAAEQPHIDMLLARGYLYTGDGPDATLVTRRLRAANPGNETIENLGTQADALTRDLADWKSILAAQIQRRPNNRALLEASAKEAETEGDFAAARADLKQIIGSGNAVTVDYNLYGWLALFQTPIASDAIPSSLHANEMSSYNNFSAIHTLACLYGTTGKPADARNTILHGMDINNLAEPNDAVWMVMGYVYEAYGATDAAIAAYRNVPHPDKPPDPTESYILAQRRLEALGVN